MSDLVEVIWAGPFHADNAPIGSTIKVPAHQAKMNPGWYQPIRKTPVSKAENA